MFKKSIHTFIFTLAVAFSNATEINAEFGAIGTETSKPGETRTGILPFINLKPADTLNTSTPDSVYTHKKNNDKISNTRKKIYQFKIEDEINASTLRQTEEMLINAENMDADYILIHLTAESGNYSAANKIKNSLLNSKTPVLFYIDKKVETSGAIVSLGADSIITAKNVQIGKVTLNNTHIDNKNKSYQYFVKTLLRSTASKKEATSTSTNNISSHITYTDPYEKEFVNAELKSALNGSGLVSFEIINYQTTRMGKMIDAITNTTGIIITMLLVVLLSILFYVLKNKGLIGILLLFTSLIFFTASYFENTLAWFSVPLFCLSIIVVLLSTKRKYIYLFISALTTLLLSFIPDGALGIKFPTQNFYLLISFALITGIIVFSLYHMKNKTLFRN